MGGKGNQKDLLAAFKRVVLKAHPDKGGQDEDVAALNSARDAWKEACKPPAPAPQPARLAAIRRVSTGAYRSKVPPATQSGPPG